MASRLGELQAAIATNVQHRDIRGQVRYNRARRQVDGAIARRISPMARDFWASLAAAAIGSWAIALLVTAVTGAPAIDTLAALGLIYAGQATYHKIRLAKDPNYKIPHCHCAGAKHDDSEIVLASRRSSILRVPNSLFATAFFAAAIALSATGHHDVLVPLAGAAVVAGALLGYEMVVRLQALCQTCITITAINVVILAMLLA